MKITRQSNKKKILLIATIVVLLAGGTAAAYWLSNRNSGDKQEGVNHEPASQTEKDAGRQSKDETIQKDTSSSSSKGNDTSYPPATPSTQMTSIPMRITASSQNNNTYQIRTLIEGVVSDGICKATLTKGNQSVTKSAAVQALAQTSTCQGFDIPTSELSPGIWQLAITFTSNTFNGSTNGTIEVK